MRSECSTRARPMIKTVRDVFSEVPAMIDSGENAWGSIEAA